MFKKAVLCIAAALVIGMAAHLPGSVWTDLGTAAGHGVCWIGNQVSRGSTYVRTRIDGDRRELASIQAEALRPVMAQANQPVINSLDSIAKNQATQLAQAAEQHREQTASATAMTTVIQNGVNAIHADVESVRCAVQKSETRIIVERGGRRYEMVQTDEFGPEDEGNLVTAGSQTYRLVPQASR